MIVNGDKLKAEGNYAAHTLYKTTTADEDGKGEVITFTDKLGRKIMEERSGSRTYFVYDNLGRLCFVLPNITSSQLTTGQFDLENATLKAIAYCYQYDARGNMIYKRLPGCEPIYMIYDVTGQLVLKQDGNQRVKNKWLLYSYDNLGRNTYTAEITMQADWRTLVAKSANEWQVGDKALSVLGLSKSATSMLMENFYDNYDFPEADKLKFANGYETPYDNAKGLLTGTRIYNLSEDGYTTTAYYYDAKGRVIQSRSVRSTDGYCTITNTKYNFDGTIAQQLTQQGNVTEHYAYTYDHAGRAKEVRYKLNNDEEILLSAFSYDRMGRLAQNLLHNSKDTIKYSYDMRNMLTETKNKRFTEQLFYADIPTDEVANATPCHNGNIAAMRVGNYDYGSFTFLNTYDQQNRLTKSSTKYGTQGTGEEFTYDDAGNILSIKRYESGSVYDNLSFYYGNEGNKLLGVTDYATDADEAGTIEYVDLGNSINEMSYDANGNNYKDLDRGIKKTIYNILNLPDTVWFENNEAIVNLYDANGTKYKSIVYSIPQSLSHPSPELVYHLYQENSMDYHETTYLGNLEVHRSKVGDYNHVDTIVHNAIGYNKNGTYYHFIKDHLGSNSIVVNTDGDYAVQDMIYHASGVPTPLNDRFGEQPYLYNGKELVESPTYEYNVYDYGFRGYYATIGRFTSMDPLCEKYYHISPYAYCANNFLNAIDPDGRTIKGVGSADIKMFRNDVLSVLHDKKFEEFNSLLKIQNNHFKTISNEDVQNALSGKELSEDEQTYINILVSAINDKRHTYKIEYVGDEISDEGIDAIRNNCYIFSNLKQENSNKFVQGMGGGFSISYGISGSFCFVDKNNDDKTRSWLSHHELLGHGIPIAYGIFGADNNSNAIRMENLVRRLLGLPQTLGERHQGIDGITNPTALPCIKFY